MVRPRVRLEVSWIIAPEGKLAVPNHFNNITHMNAALSPNSRIDALVGFLKRPREAGFHVRKREAAAPALNRAQRSRLRFVFVPQVMDLFLVIDQELGETHSD